MNYPKPIILVAILLLSASWCMAADTPFGPGEKFTYRLTCLGMEAGVGVLEVGATLTVGGVECYHLINRIESVGIFSNFFYVKDRIDAYCGVDDLLTRLYKKSEWEGKNKDSYTMIFDQKAHTVSRGETTIRVPKDTRDELTTFYYLRTIDLEPGQVFNMPNTDGERNRTLIITVGKRETITTPAGTFKTISVNVDMEDAATVFSGKVQAKLWLSDDVDRMVVRLESKLAVGSLSADLVSYTKAK